MDYSNTSAINLKIWFNQTLEWLYKDGTKISLQDPHSQILRLMQTAYENNTPKRVWEIIGELDELTRTSETRERGEILLRCAKMACELENLKEAENLCNEAQLKFRSFNHQHAVSLWTIGCIQWVHHQNVKAIANWQTAISLFEAIKSGLEYSKGGLPWHEDMIPRLKDYLKKAISENELPPYVEKQEPDLSKKVFLPQNSTSSESPDSLKWVAVAIDNPVAAGGFKPVGNTPPKGHLEISEVLIANDPYSIHVIKKKSLWKNTIIVNSNSNEYRTIPVEGTSMNKATPVPIESGDYVLVRLQPTFEDNEIVVAAILEFEQIATIKRGKKINATTFQLLPESYDESHYRNPYFGRDLNGREVNILGVVEAVFKKKT